MRHVTQTIPGGPELARRLRQARGDRTQAEVAAEAGVDRSQYVNWENGRGMDVKNVPRVAAALGIDPAELLSVREWDPLEDLRVRLGELRAVADDNVASIADLRASVESERRALADLRFGIEGRLSQLDSRVSELGG